MTSQRGAGSGRLMGLDVGGKRTGVAISDEFGVLASPVGLVLRGARDRAEFRDLVRRWSVTRLVVGLPKSLSGREGPQAAEVRAYADSLAADLGLEIDYWDERLTSTMAERALIESGSSRKKRRDQIDSVAAALILQNYLDAKRPRRAD
jgi:putative Holliday junction resolvase